MIKKIARLTLFFLVLGLLFNKQILASGFNLKSIGGLSTEGRQISHWWYASTNAPMVGDAAASSTVNITIDGTATTATADSSGSWSYNPTGLSEGDHTIALENNGSTINFTLTLGADKVDWTAVEKDAGTTTLPAAGMPYPTLALLLVGGSLILVSRKLAKQR